MSKYKTSLANNEVDMQELEKFWVEKATWSKERFSWFYKDNGYGNPSTSILYVDTENSVIGCASYFSRSFHIGTNDLIAGINCDALVDNAHRTLGPALLIIKALLKSFPAKESFLLGFPNKKSKPLFQRCGYKEIGKYYRWSKVLRFDKKLKKVIKSNILSKVASIVINFGLMLINGEFIFKISHKSGEYTLEKYRGNSLLGNKYSNSLDDIDNFGGRDDNYVLWRYSRHADKLNYDIYSIQKSGTEIGYLVSAIEGDTVVIHDISPLPVEDFKFVLMKFTSIARRLNVDTISIGFFGSKNRQIALRKLNFVRRESRSVIFYSENDALINKLLNEDRWYLMNGDVDL